MHISPIIRRLPALAIAALFILGATGYAEDSAVNQRQERELEKVRNRYTAALDEIEKDRTNLHEQHIKYCDEIRQRVDALPGSVVALTDANADVQPPPAEGTAAVRDLLQELQRLCGQRYNEIETVLGAREALEERRYAQARDSIPDYVRLRETSRRDRDTTIRLQRMSMQDKLLAQNAAYISNRQALEELQNLVLERTKSERKLLEDQVKIMQDMQRADRSQSRMERYRNDLQEIARKNAMEEEKFKLGYQHINEKLALEQYRSREFGRMEDYHNAIERTWNTRQANLEKRREDIKARLDAGNLSDAAKRDIEQEMKDIENRISNEKKTYSNATMAVESRRELINREVNDRLRYLDDRNRINMRIAEKPSRADGFFMRGQIRALEDRRMNAEHSLRTNIMMLADSVPSTYRYTPGGEMDAEAMRAQIAASVEDRTQQLRRTWGGSLSRLEDEIQAIDEQLAKGGMSSAEKVDLENTRNGLASRASSMRRGYNRAVKALADRKALEESRIADLQQYRDARGKILARIDAGDVNSEEQMQLENQLRDLDLEWQTKEIDFNQRLQPLQELLSPAAHQPEAASNAI